MKGRIGISEPFGSVLESKMDELEHIRSQQEVVQLTLEGGVTVRVCGKGASASCCCGSHRGRSLTFGPVCGSKANRGSLEGVVAQRFISRRRVGLNAGLKNRQEKTLARVQRSCPRSSSRISEMLQLEFLKILLLLIFCV